MIKLNNLNKVYKDGNVTALKNINVQLDNHITGILGHNGAGKTSLMDIISTYDMKYDGEVIIDDIVLTYKTREDIKKGIGYMPQDFNCNPNMKVVDILFHYAYLNKINKNNAKDLVTSVLNKTNLIDEKSKRYRQLSGGMKRRLGLALTLIKKPSILIVDEPTTGVDPEERIRIRDLLCELKDEMTILISSHVLEDISMVCNSIIVLVKGEIIYQGDINGMIKIVKDKIYYSDIKDKYIKGMVYINTEVVEGKTKQFYVKVDEECNDSDFNKVNDITIEQAYMALNFLHNYRV